MKHDENHATYNSLMVQSFTHPQISVRVKNPLKFVMETTRLAKQDELRFAKNCFAKIII